MVYYRESDLEQELKEMEKCLSEYLRDPGFGGALSEILCDMEKSRGKRLRPRLLLLAGRFGPDFEQKRLRLCRLAALVELVHMASLIHDDIVDDSPLRRGLPTVQEKYGKDRAVYAGDLLLSRIVQSLFRDGYVRVGQSFGQAVEEMCVGEVGQMSCRYREDVTVGQYMRNIYGKTAALCRLACSAGAAESGCSEEVKEMLEELGINFGYMFQIRDDLLDFISTSAEEGKPTQVDFREGIYTLPVIYAMQDGQYRPRIIRLMQLAKKGGFGAAEEEELKALVVDSGGLAHASTDMKIYAQKAMRAVEYLPDHGVSTVFRELLHKNM